MKLKIPMTGKVKDIDTALMNKGEIGIGGDPNDPVRVVNLDLGGIAWRLVGINLETDLMEVEVEAPETADFPVLDGNGLPVLEDGKPKFFSRALTSQEKQLVLANARHILESHTVDEIYAITGDKRLVKPTKVMKKYRACVSGGYLA